LGLKACAKALEETDYFVRTINANFIPLDRVPNRWLPSTYGEWFDGFRGVWRLLEGKIETLPKKETNRAARILRGSAYGLGKIPAVSEMVMRLLETS
jgi:hypothetical protein